jgi:hypothetical protein
MNSPRYSPAGLLVSYCGRRVMIDGGPGAEPAGRVDAWLLTDEQAELIAPLRRLAARYGVKVHAGAFTHRDLHIEPRPVAHTSHPTWGYLICTPAGTAAWAPEFWTFPQWASGVQVMFAEAAGWRRPIRFTGGVGGHMAACDVAEQAARYGVARLVLAHIGRPALRAIDAGEQLTFGEWGVPGRTYLLSRQHTPGHSPPDRQE